MNINDWCRLNMTNEILSQLHRGDSHGFHAGFIETKCEMTTCNHANCAKLRAKCTSLPNLSKGRPFDFCSQIPTLIVLKMGRTRTAARVFAVEHDEVSRFGPMRHVGVKWEAAHTVTARKCIWLCFNSGLRSNSSDRLGTSHIYTEYRQADLLFLVSRVGTLHEPGNIPCFQDLTSCSEYPYG